MPKDVAESPEGIPSKRGFADWEPDRQREVAARGGRAAHARGTAHEYTPEEARLAGSAGGRVSHDRGTAHRFTPEQAREAGRKGGLARRAKARACAADEVAVEEPDGNR